MPFDPLLLDNAFMLPPPPVDEVLQTRRLTDYLLTLYGEPANDAHQCDGWQVSDFRRQWQVLLNTLHEQFVVLGLPAEGLGVFFARFFAEDGSECADPFLQYKKSAQAGTNYYRELKTLLERIAFLLAETPYLTQTKRGVCCELGRQLSVCATGVLGGAQHAYRQLRCANTLPHQLAAFRQNLVDIFAERFIARRQADEIAQEIAYERREQQREVPVRFPAIDERLAASRRYWQGLSAHATTHFTLMAHEQCQFTLANAAGLRYLDDTFVTNLHVSAGDIDDFKRYLITAYTPERIARFLATTWTEQLIPFRSKNLAERDALADFTAWLAPFISEGLFTIADCLIEQRGRTLINPVWLNALSFFAYSHLINQGVVDNVFKQHLSAACKVVADCKLTTLHYQVQGVRSLELASDAQSLALVYQLILNAAPMASGTTAGRWAAFKANWLPSVKTLYQALQSDFVGWSQRLLRLYSQAIASRGWALHQNAKPADILAQRLANDSVSEVQGNVVSKISLLLQIKSEQSLSLCQQLSADEGSYQQVLFSALDVIENTGDIVLRGSEQAIGGSRRALCVAELAENFIFLLKLYWLQAECTQPAEVLPAALINKAAHPTQLLSRLCALPLIYSHPALRSLRHAILIHGADVHISELEAVSRRVPLLRENNARYLSALIELDLPFGFYATFCTLREAYLDCAALLKQIEPSQWTATLIQQLNVLFSEQGAPGLQKLALILERQLDFARLDCWLGLPQAVLSADNDVLAALKDTTLDAPLIEAINALFRRERVRAVKAQPPRANADAERMGLDYLRVVSRHYDLSELSALIALPLALLAPEQQRRRVRVMALLDSSEGTSINQLYQQHPQADANAIFDALMRRDISADLFQMIEVDRQTVVMAIQLARRWFNCGGITLINQLPIAYLRHESFIDWLNTIEPKALMPWQMEKLNSASRAEIGVQTVLNLIGANKFFMTDIHLWRMADARASEPLSFEVYFFRQLQSQLVFGLRYPAVAVGTPLIERFFADMARYAAALFERGYLTNFKRPLVQGVLHHCKPGWGMAATRWCRAEAYWQMAQTVFYYYRTTATMLMLAICAEAPWEEQVDTLMRLDEQLHALLIKVSRASEVTESKRLALRDNPLRKNDVDGLQRLHHTLGDFRQKIAAERRLIAEHIQHHQTVAVLKRQ